MIFYQSKGILDYSGENRLVLNIDLGINAYYRALIPKSLPNLKPRYAAHITVVREYKEKVINREFWGKYQDEEVEFYYSPEIRCEGNYFWLDCFSTRLEEIRSELGLPLVSIREPPFPWKKRFHTTLAIFEFFNKVD